MKSKFIPSSRKAALAAQKIIENEVKALETKTSTRKRISLQDELNKERLAGLLFTETLNMGELDILERLLDPKEFVKTIAEESSSLAKLSKTDLINQLSETILHLKIERGYAEILFRSINYLWHRLDSIEYKKTRQSTPRQKGREELFVDDNKRLQECLENAPAPRTTVQSPLIWSADAQWKLDYSNIERLSSAEIKALRDEAEKVRIAARDLRIQTVGS